MKQRPGDSLGTKKAKVKGKKVASKSSTSSGETKSAKTSKQVDLVEVRKKISEVVGPLAPQIIQAIVDEAMKGQLAHAKYALESGGIFPAAESDPMHPEEDSLAMTLLKRMGLKEQSVAGAEESQVSVPSVHHAQADSNGQAAEKVSITEKCTISQSEQQALTDDNTVK
jgi:hypothetical protein